VKSMTSYAQGSFSSSSMRFSIELKSYNNRYLDVSINLSQALSPLEPFVRAYLLERVSRGKLECTIRVREFTSEVAVRIDEKAARAGAEALRKLSGLLGRESAPSLSELLSLDGVLSMERDLAADSLWTEIRPFLDKVFADYDAERSREGSRLREDMASQLASIRKGSSEVAELMPQLEAALTETMRRRLREAVGEGYDENRILQETAMSVMRYTVNEELARLSSHVEAMDAELAKTDEAGKRIDFLCQEMNREVNTLGSKNQLPRAGGLIVSLKEAIENIREQARNVE
jgi:uncharacterized protein (TIGR00255 family)